MTGAPPTVRRGPTSTWAVVALVAGIALGIAGHSLGWTAFRVLAGALRPIGQLWISALLLLVLPLVITTTLASITGMPRGESAGLGARALVAFVTALAISGVVTVGVGSAIIEQLPVNADAVAALFGQHRGPHSALKPTRCWAGWLPMPASGAGGRWRRCGHPLRAAIAHRNPPVCRHLLGK